MLQGFELYSTGGEGESVLEIALQGCIPNTQVHDLTQLIEHFVYFNPKGDMLRERTSYVYNSIAARQAYTDFLKYMDARGLKFTNDFEELWRDNPGRYPL